MELVVNQVLELSGLERLNPPQEMAIERGLLNGESLVVASPTASGKTIIAEMAALNVMKSGRKAVYIVPLRALANEKYSEFKEKFGKLGFKVAVSTGDLDNSDGWLREYDLIVTTSEKLDSLLRHGIDWLQEIGLVVCDEIHLIDSPERGPTLEIVLTRLRHSTKAQILGLSATISNYKELAEWLGAKAVYSDYRPVRLYRGICLGKKVRFVPKKGVELVSSNSLLELVKDTLEKNKQLVVFLSTRRAAESLAENIGKIASRYLKEEEKMGLERIGGKVGKSLESPTKQCERLRRCLMNGSAFHHAGLAGGQRKLIEDNFRGGLIKIIGATPTLAAGLNLPAFRVIIRDLKRFSRFHGMGYIPVMEIEQMLGRAGRPKYDDFGEGILMTKTSGEARFSWEKYIRGEPEKIVSKLGMEPVLRMHTLALVASGIVSTQKELGVFFSKSFYGHQYGDVSGLGRLLGKVLKMLEGFGFVETEDDRLKATRIGRRVSELYIDPLSANHIIESLKRVKRDSMNAFGWLHILTGCLEAHPLLNLRKKDGEWIEEILLKVEPFLMGGVPSESDLEYEEFLKSLKTAGMFHHWISEAGEDFILDKLNVTPGELRGRLDIADWLIYSTQELGVLTGHLGLVKDIRKVRMRLKYGVGEELLPLCKLKGIGRKRSRLLYNSGIKGLAELRRMPLQSLERLVGVKVAGSIKDQLGEA